MINNKMYSQRAKQGNIPVFRGCSFRCVYCSFKRLIQLNKKCLDCAVFEPHSHMEVLKRTAPSTRDGNFVTVGLSSDISFMDGGEFYQVLEYCHNHPFTTFLIQSKNPAYFLTWQYMMPRNVILGTTIETNRGRISENPLTYYYNISGAPYPYKRYASMMKLKESGCRLLVTTEPLLDFDLDSYSSLCSWIKKLNPIFYIGYANDGKQGKRLKLPEPPREKTLELIRNLENAKIDVRLKSIRKAWWEE